MKAVVFTLGCKVNECESDSLIQGLLLRGYSVVDKLEVANLYIVNTCAVTKEAEKKSRQMVSRIQKLNPNAKIIFTGCASQKNPQSFAKKSNSFLVTGTFNKNKILDLIDKEGICVCEQNDAFEELLPVKSLRTRTFVKVEDGCNNFCSYCIIPYLRGRVRSRNPENVLSEIIKTTPKEAVITGINLSGYNYNGVGLDGLLDRLKEAQCRIRLGSLEVNVINDKFLTACKNLKDFAPHFHLSLQSGSNNVLKSMNRRYTREEFIEKVNLIRNYFPNCAITTDIIAGFPTESEQDFLDTIELVKTVEFSDIHPFAYSPREGTVSYKMKDLPYDVKKARLDKLLELKNVCHSNYIDKFVGEKLTVIFEERKDGYSTGYTENYLKVYVKEEFTSGQKFDIIIKDKFNDGVIAQVIR